MRIVTAGLAAVLASAAVGTVLAESLQDQIQDQEQPGSRIEFDFGRGRMFPAPPPIQIGGNQIPFPNDPDSLDADDPVDAALPGEGPEDLSGPGDDDSLPQ
jgi:hypothetical protein